MKLHPSDRCACKSPHGTGRLYYGYEACLCDKLIVLNRAEREALKAEELRIFEAERSLRVGGQVNKFDHSEWRYGAKPNGERVA